MRTVNDPLLERQRRSAVASVDVEELYRTHARRLVRLAAAITFDGDRAEELVHDAFTELQRRADSIAAPEQYLQRTVVNLSLKLLRRRAVRDRYRPPPAPPSYQPEVDEMWDAIVRLPPRQRVVVALRFWEDLSEAETAAALGWPAGTVKSTLHRALQRLRKELQR